MSFIDTQLSQNRPASVRCIELPRRERYHPSPADWRDETLYFLLPDRFSDGQEDAAFARPLRSGRRPSRYVPTARRGDGIAGRNRAPSAGRAGRCAGFVPSSAT